MTGIQELLWCSSIFSLRVAGLRLRIFGISHVPGTLLVALPSHLGVVMHPLLPVHHGTSYPHCFLNTAAIHLPGSHTAMICELLGVTNDESAISDTGLGYSTKSLSYHLLPACGVASHYLFRP
ncbi:hypothetical protein PISMIDRAFT_389051 [Pisolithus microcarpus 441]|uniref:Uncharacterized protein n=1 Tax=Pisolithus microcarpus 441 TaxID=765257 RepID=A0A0C9YYJ8_9AGAM|nr:hypothetical protein PISMIDRAFT_389051 [Pisolithus microcarpus 441]